MFVLPRRSPVTGWKGISHTRCLFFIADPLLCERFALHKDCFLLKDSIGNSAATAGILLLERNGQEVRGPHRR